MARTWETLLFEIGGDVIDTSPARPAFKFATNPRREPSVAAASKPQLVAKLFDGPLDIIGDLHGECGTLCKLLARLGYDGHGNHPEGRKYRLV